LVGADFCGAPWDGDIKQFAPLFAECKSRGLKLTIHTAELALHAFETEDILFYEPDRLGHFLHATEEQMRRVAAYQGLVEVCPTSNV
jgi:adenosine deaminase